MKRTLIAIGCLLLLPLPSAEATLYQAIHTMVEQEESTVDLDPRIARYVSSLFQNDWNLTEEDVSQLARNEWWDVCGRLTDASRGKYLAECMHLTQEVQAVVKQEINVQRLGHDLQAIATGYEVPVSDLPGRPVRLSADLRGIVSLWSAGTGSIKGATGSLIRTKTVDPRAMSGLTLRIGSVLRQLSEEELIAAVWRYQYGYRLVKGERAPRFPAPVVDTASGPGTERQYLFKRWTPVETALEDVWKAVKDTRFDPSLSKTETALLLFPTELQKLLPEGITLWARVDRSSNEGRPMGDIGLQWTIPLRPVLPSLLTSDGEPIRGGTYPPEPVTTISNKRIEVNGNGLCSMHGSERGYLCRPITQSGTGSLCPPSPVQLGTIALVSCIKQDSARQTITGSDVCREINWDTARAAQKPIDIQTQCTVKMHCETQCGTGQLEGLAKTKDANGVVDLCIKKGQRTVTATYLLYHELIHAGQYCVEPPLWNQYEEIRKQKLPAAEERQLLTQTCCRLEGEAYRAQCDLMERDGVIGSGSTASYQGITLNAESCAEALTDYSCGPRDGYDGCPVSRTYPEGFLDHLMQIERTNNPKNLPATCEDINRVTEAPRMFEEARIKTLKETIERRDDVSEPGQVNQYKNRIGNNLCAIGQYVEESLELHQLTPGRNPITAGDSIAPWNSPLTGVPMGNLLMNPPEPQISFPPYRPELLVRTLENTLCQLQGLPPQTPPVLCAAEANRRLSLPLLTPAQTILSLLAQSADQQTTEEQILSLAPALGSRVGTSLYASYLRDASRSLAGVLAMATQLFSELQTVEFPTEMCPLDGGIPIP